MMGGRTIADRLREEYFELLPHIRRVVDHLDAEVKYCLLPISRKLDKHEQLVVTSRIKECESALDSLRRKEEGGTFDSDQPTLYTLATLKDLAGVRVMTFPRSRLAEVNQILHGHFGSWQADPGFVGGDQRLGFKYYGSCEASTKVVGELQIVSMLAGLFWEVEHSVIYKPDPQLKGVGRSPKMEKRTGQVLDALTAFEDDVEDLVRRDPLRNHHKRERSPE